MNNTHLLPSVLLPDQRGPPATFTCDVCLQRLPEMFSVSFSSPHVSWEMWDRMQGDVWDQSRELAYIIRLKRFAQEEVHVLWLCLRPCRSIEIKFANI